MKSDKLLLYGGIAVGAYLLYQYMQGNLGVAPGAAATPQEEAQAAATTLSANLASTLGVQ
jgi:hypothetical protein